MPKYLFVDRAQGQASSAPNAAATSITLTSTPDTNEFTAAGSPSATSPIPAILTDTSDITTATLIETVLVTNITGSPGTFTITRDADGNGASDFSAGDCYITCSWSRFAAENVVQRDGDTAKRLAGVPVDRTADISGNALAFDYTKGDYQYVTLSTAGTVLTVTNMPAGAIMKLILIDADTYAPDISAFTPVLNADTISFGKYTVIMAETLTNTTVRYIAGGTYAS